MCKNSKKVFRWLGLATVQLAMLGMLGGCTEVKDDESNFVIVERESTPIDYKLVSVTRNDIVKTKMVSCKYSQLDSQKLSFGVSGKRVSKVYVHEGDSVKKGDLLAVLSGADKEEELYRLRYQINRNKERLAQLQENENNEINRRWLDYQVNQTRQKYFSGYAYDNGQQVLAGVEEYQKNNRYTIEDLTDSIKLDEQQLKLLETEVAQSKLYALADGNVSSIKKRLEGSTSVMDEVVIEILDSSECSFMVSDMTYADVVEEGVELEMTIMSGTSAGKYKVIPVDKANWKDAMSFEISDGGDNVIFEAGTSGSIYLELDKRTQVLTLPTAAVHTADEKSFVYTVGDNDIREVKWIETGLVGSDLVEITGGLSEGDKVILK